MKKRYFSFCLFLACSLLPFKLWSQAPVNDSCQYSIVLNCDTTVYGSTLTATGDSAAAPTCFASNTPTMGVWYKITGDGSYIIASTCDSADFDTKIAVYSGSCGSLTCIAGNDDYCGLASTTGFASVMGTDYYILVNGFGVSVGSFGLTITCMPPCLPTPANDSCASAATLTYYSDPNNCIMTTWTNECASLSPNDNCLPFANIQDVWFEFTTGADSIITMTFNELTGSNFQYAIYETSCDSAADVCGPAAGTTIFNNVIMSHTYWLRISNNGFSEAGTFEICISGPPPTPTNNFCDSSIIILMSDSCLFTSGSVYMATQETAPLDSCNGYLSATAFDVFYSFIATATDATVHVQPSFDAVLEVYDNCGEARLGCSDELDLIDEYVQLSGLTIGNTYFARVFPWGNAMPASTSFDICVTEGFVFAGLNDEEDKINCKIYPNPVMDLLNINTNILDASYQITNLLGNTIMNGQLSSTIDVATFASGIYILTITKENKIVYHTRFIKQ